MTYNIPSHLKGLSENELQEAREKYGFNETVTKQKSGLLKMMTDILKEPMLILLIFISVIYLLIGDYAEAAFMFCALIIVFSISFFQDNRSRRALEALSKMNEPFSTVIRNSEVIKIPSREISVGDLVIVEEGKMINADGTIVHSNDFSADESFLTGESYAVYKDNQSGNNNVYNGTVAVSGLAIFEVRAIGSKTRLGEIGTSLNEIEQEQSPLQLQIRKFVRYMAVIGVIIFLIVWGYSFWLTRSLMDSLLVGLTLAMSVLPEEIPVAFTTFMALGARKLMQEDVIIKRSNVVETLGSTTVICADKTGTITENSMHLKMLYDFKTDRLVHENDFNDEELNELIAYSMWGSEPVPFDPMEKSIHNVYERTCVHDERRGFRMIHEYPLEGRPPMMTHIFENEAGERIIAAKGAPGAILAVAELADEKKEIVWERIRNLTEQGYRILGVGKTVFTGDNFPRNQQDFRFEFLGLVVFYDPPKPGIKDVFRKIYDAGIQLKIITGDNAETARAIALQAGLKDAANAYSGQEISDTPENELPEKVKRGTLFSRMFPEAKLTVVNALKKEGEIVAMVGDGVNDAPALKAAHIGVAMGHKGTEVAKATASLIITNDDLDRLVTGIAAGRRIYTNLKKAIRYIISIHIPIMLTVSLPLLLGWSYPEIFTPVHVIFLELIMGPTCSIVYENEPMERDAMHRRPRKMTDTFLSTRELLFSIVQGLVITVGVLLSYQWSVMHGGTEQEVRAMVFATLIFANVWLSLSNRSFYYSLFQSFHNKNKLLAGIIILTLTTLALILYVEPFTSFFSVASLPVDELAFAFFAGAFSILWVEVYKRVIRRRSPEQP